ncbi:SDR family NAD(P)-dependent oxidoreductase [Steroidobacter cummioxidans]|uniref:SDR family NAD(P)-dependent oxidoreductase n=1 Tax=Steroidobacter cummioxidans TaxID=1803913 RepID=UPI000E30F278|nr:SDR family NAD(P)-dependent oxidoreductase [Steroidobacter cummioxidans]
MNLSGRKIVITGAFGALGSKVAVAVRAAGASVTCIDFSSPDRAPESLRGCVLLGGVDLGIPDAAAAALRAAAKQMGGLDGLVNIAGGFRWEKIQGGGIATWDQLYGVNLRTAVNAVQAALPLVGKEHGRIINVGAAASIKAGAGMGAYAASKAGVAKLTEALADELKDQGVCVNAILPSIIDTPANRADMPDADYARWVQPEQIADLVVFLLSNHSSAITGALIPIVGRV